MCSSRLCSLHGKSEFFWYGTIHLRHRQIFTIFDPYPPTIGIPAKCYEGDFWSLCTVTFRPSAYVDTPPPLRHADVLMDGP